MKSLRIASKEFAPDQRPPRPDDTFHPITPAQFYDLNTRAHHLDGETRLLFAVLEDAVRCYATAARSSRLRHQRALDEVREWVNLRGEHDLFSFDSICRIFDLEPELLRRQLNSMPAVNFQRRRFTTVGRSVGMTVPK
jgi:hypothetical protein